MTPLTLQYRVLASKGISPATRQTVDMIVGSAQTALRIKLYLQRQGYAAATQAVPAPKVSVRA